MENVSTQTAKQHDEELRHHYRQYKVRTHALSTLITIIYLLTNLITNTRRPCRDNCSVEISYTTQINEKLQMFIDSPDMSSKILYCDQTTEYRVPCDSTQYLRFTRFRGETPETPKQQVVMIVCHVMIKNIDKNIKIK